MSTKFVQMLILGLPLIFLRQGQICDPIHLYGKNVETSFSQTVLKKHWLKLLKGLK